MRVEEIVFLALYDRPRHAELFKVTLAGELMHERYPDLETFSWYYFIDITFVLFSSIFKLMSPVNIEESKLLLSRFLTTDFIYLTNRQL